MTNYCTLDDTQRQLKSQQTATAPLEDVRTAIRVVSSRIDEVMGSFRKPFFAPRLEQRQYRINANRINTGDGVFWLREHILAFTEVLWGTSDITSKVELYTDGNEVRTGLRLTNEGESWYSSESPPVFVKVTGTWGYHPDWANAWDSVDTIQDAAGITASATTVTVVDADGEDLNNLTPRFSPGNLIAIGSEYMDVTKVAANVLTIRRGRNGTTAAAHANGAAISTFQVDDRIRRIASRQSGLFVARRGGWQVETLDGVGAITYPQDLMPELRNALAEFVYA
jgi:hypothetical protein